jgi:hypothetical protein
VQRTYAQQKNPVFGENRVFFDWCHSCVHGQVKKLERAMGFEPTTFSLARRRSTTEPRPHILAKRLASQRES